MRSFMFILFLFPSLFAQIKNNNLKGFLDKLPVFNRYRDLYLVVGSTFPLLRMYCELFFSIDQLRRDYFDLKKWERMSVCVRISTYCCPSFTNLISSLFSSPFLFHLVFTLVTSTTHMHLFSPQFCPSMDRYSSETGRKFFLALMLACTNIFDNILFRLLLWLAISRALSKPMIVYYVGWKIRVYIMLDGKSEESWGSSEYAQSKRNTMQPFPLWDDVQIVFLSLATLYSWWRL